MEAQVAFLPSVEIMVKVMVVISSAAVAAASNTCGRVIFTSHHPALLGTGKRDGVWRVSSIRSVG